MGYQSMPPPMGRPDSRGTMPPPPKLVSCWRRRPPTRPAARLAAMQASSHALACWRPSEGRPRAGHCLSTSERCTQCTLNLHTISRWIDSTIVVAGANVLFRLCEARKAHRLETPGPLRLEEHIR